MPALAFLIPGMLGAWLGGPIGRWLPDEVQAGLFSVIAAVAAVRMLRSAQQPSGSDGTAPRASLAKGAFVGFAIGILTSIIGVGGGFLAAVDEEEIARAQAEAGALGLHHLVGLPHFGLREGGDLGRGGILGAADDRERARRRKQRIGEFLSESRTDTRND